MTGWNDNQVPHETWRHLQVAKCDTTQVICDTSDTWNAKCDIKLTCDTMCDKSDTMCDRCDTMCNTCNTMCNTCDTMCNTCDTRPHCQEECDGDLDEPQSL